MNNSWNSPQGKRNCKILIVAILNVYKHLSRQYTYYIYKVEIHSFLKLYSKLDIFFNIKLSYSENCMIFVLLIKLTTLFYENIYCRFPDFFICFFIKF